ncbi:MULTISPECIES: sarcosine oxidase subunit beta family protein [Brucella]|uniref:Sarcosine oxidase subunit beta n=1 Tax=Brucella lupini TaxID=255457 RepID=A0A256GRX1_9HYPH|nr:MULTISPECIES: sarcosine oxidase subunit beta family protein [Brucella]RNL45149.1 sarcosine oxidase subunit beta family protein [Ochrobactrum sp. MH181795]KAB2702532.1 sarcosine oxidase subunit beta family protein [Brucella lupini]KAB2727024.1 sarcosine oxidase subunit beta family protein [Brucella anthropi]KAB2744185.1 sarcosine oxidase subunit beta family protein [Brucella anthropi]KAB2796777.1 sarcosine oxidase subunit beta family protein [Brucella anthropi]
MSRFSAASIIKNALSGNKNWKPQWPNAEPKAEYDVIIVGAGGHGLGAAYYLAKEHGITNVAVIEKGWLGGGNTGRNTTIIRSNYLYDESAHLYEHAMKLWEGLSQDLNYNVMFSQRGVMMLAHTVHDVQSFKRHIHANRLNGIDNEWLTKEQAKEYCPPLDISANARYPVVGATLQRRGGVARHDAVAWGYARGATERGVDIIQNCPVTAIRRDVSGRVTGVDTPRGFIKAKKVAVSAAGSTSIVMDTAGVRMPLESFPLQALVSEPVKPIFPCVVMSNTVHAYISQSDKGELVIGSGTDQYVSYSQRGGLPLIEHTLAAICEVFPIFTRMRMLRKWGGIVDVTPDRSPIIGKTPVPGLFVNCGWGTGGFKATPGSAHVFAHTIACDEPHWINAPFTLERFTTGRLIDEAAAAAVAH